MTLLLRLVPDISARMLADLDLSKRGRLADFFSGDPSPKTPGNPEEASVKMSKSALPKSGNMEVEDSSRLKAGLQGVFSSRVVIPRRGEPTISRTLSR